MAETVIRSIIRQSIDANTLPDNMERQLKELYRKPLVELQDWVRLLRERIEHSSTFFIFVDDLDECDVAERRALLDALSSLATTSTGLRIFIASRDSVSVDLKNKFPRIERVSMACDGLTSDIRLHVEAAVQERIRNEDLVVEDPCLLDEIKNTLTRHADGM